MLEIVRERVKPQRDKVKRKAYRERWWRYAEAQHALYSRITNLDRVIVRPRVSNTHAPVFINTGVVFSDAVVVFVLDKYWQWAVLQSSLHEKWARKYCSTLKNDLRYSATDAFENFPFPNNNSELDSVGLDIYELRQRVMLNYGEGLTKIQNKLNDPKNLSQDIVQLRNAYANLDNIVTNAYGWGDLVLDHGFHDTKQGICFTISDEARRELLQRLLKLNHERYEEEVAKGLHDKKKAKKGSTSGEKKTTPAKNGKQQLLF